MDEATILVSETPDGPTMPFDAWRALQRLKLLREVDAFLDSVGVPRKHRLRDKAARQAIALIDEVSERDLAKIQADLAVKQ